MTHTTTETNYSRRDVLKLGLAGLAGLLGTSTRAEDKPEKDGSPNGHIVFYDPKAKAIKVIDGNEAISPKTLDKIVKKVEGVDVAEVKEFRPTHDPNVIFALYVNSNGEDTLASIDLPAAKGKVEYQGKKDEIKSFRLSTGNDRGREFENVFYAGTDNKFYQVHMADGTSEEVDKDNRDYASTRPPKGNWTGEVGTRWSPKEVHVVDEYVDGTEVEGVYALELADGKAKVTVTRENSDKKPVLRTFEFNCEPWQIFWMHPDNR